jgi:hypothetical protein
VPHPYERNFGNLKEIIPGLECIYPDLRLKHTNNYAHILDEISGK